MELVFLLPPPKGGVILFYIKQVFCQCLLQFFRCALVMQDVALHIQLEGFPDAKKEEYAVVVVVCRLRCGIEEFRSAEDGNEELLRCKTNVCVALLHVFRKQTPCLLCGKVFQLQGIGRADLYIGIILLHCAQEVLVETEYHDCLEGRKQLILHVGHTNLLSGETETVEGKHLALAEMLQGDDGARSVCGKLHALKAVVHQIGLLQSLPQNGGHIVFLRNGETVGLEFRAVESAEYRKRKSIRTEADG